MTAHGRMSQVAGIVAAALDVLAEDRDQFIAQRCPDPVMRAAVMDCLGGGKLLDATFGVHSRNIRDLLNPVVSDLPQRTWQEMESPTIGSVLPDRRGHPRFEVLDIKAGGCSLVYIGVDREHERPFAAKTLPQCVFSVRPDFIPRLEQEASAWARIPPHHNIVTLLSVERIGGKPYLFMPYYPQGDLAGAIARGRLADRSRLCLYYAIQICDGLVHAYQHGMAAHRDIKPANCFLHGDVFLSVADFGISKPSWSGQDLSSGFGSHGYAPPEQGILGGVADRRSDVYSIGVTLHEMLTGKLPGPTPSISRVPAQLNAHIRRCLEPDPDRRFQDARELRSALADAFAEIAGQPAPPPLAPFFSANDPLTLLNQARQHCELGEFDLALSLYDTILATHPDNAAAHHDRADTLWRMGRPEEARLAIERAIHLSSVQGKRP